MSDTINTQLRMLAAEAREMGFNEADILDRAADLHDELLEALRPFAASATGLEITINDLDRARAAFAKATGGRATAAETQPGKAGA